MIKSIFLSVSLVLAVLTAGAKNITVEILAQKNLKQFEIKVTRGVYVFNYNSRFIRLKKGAILKVSNGEISVGDSINFKTQALLLNGTDYLNHFEISLNGEQYSYDDDLRLLMNGYKTRLLNIVDLDHYVAGVVEGEAGYNLPLEYYKLQAILCRTYALKNMNRHAAEGFNLCDQVHCQVYHHKCTKNNIVKATAATSGLVVVDDDLALINTTFHSNCGGQTANSEDVWLSEVSYLRSVRDSFCTNSRSSDWMVTLPLVDFKSFFSKNHPLDSFELQRVLTLCQDTARFPHKKLISTELTKLRTALKLKSTFFSIEPDSNQVVLYGKGYGHGVGLCQQGGIEMAKKGYSYVDILKYYYTQVYIVNQRALLFFKED